ncbi:MAG: hypothetical protein JXN65_07625 [Clostridia bacterium]|nr:hypothetical protein [Clostridia bacterium]
MNKKTSTTVLTLFIIGAIFLGLLLVNKGDGPVMGMILAENPIENTADYNKSAQEQSEGTYLVLSNAFNKYQEDYSTSIPEGSPLYASVHFVECPQGAQYTGKWIFEGELLKEETGTLSTGPEGVISYMLEGGKVAKGSYTFELYDGDKKVFERNFSVK